MEEEINSPFKGRKVKLKRNWHKLYRRQAATVAGEPLLGLDMRLFFLAVSRAGFNGHAEFRRGELADWLKKYNLSTGAVSTYTERRFQKVISDGVAANIYGPGSNVRCLIVASHLVDVDRPPSSWKVCPEHHHRYRWFKDCWAQIDRDGNLGWVQAGGTVLYPGKTRTNSSHEVA